jgi:hypothetical protein
MDGVELEPGAERALVERTTLAVHAHLGFHRAYNSDQAALGWLPPILAPLARSRCVATLHAAAPDHTGGLRSHPLGPAMLAGVEDAAALTDDEGREALRDRTRRKLERGVRTAWVTARLGPVAADCLSAGLLESLRAEPEWLLDALAAELRRRPRTIVGLSVLRRLLGRLDPARPDGPTTGAPRRAEDLLFDRLQSTLRKLEAQATELTGQKVCVYLGPPGLAPALALAEGRLLKRALPDREPFEDQAGPPTLLERSPSNAAPPPTTPALPAGLVRLRAWCRRMLPLLTPFLQERLLLPV